MMKLRRLEADTDAIAIMCPGQRLAKHDARAVQAIRDRVCPVSMREMRLLPTLGSAFAGAVGFVAGYYAAFFAVLGIWGLDFDASLIPLAAGIPAGLVAGGAIALTVSSPRKLVAFLIAGALGLILTVLIVVLNGDAGAMLVGGVVLMVVTALIVRSGMADRLVGA